MQYPKGSQAKVSKYFKAYEFDCPCKQPSCQYTEVDLDFAAKLDLVREDLGCALTINHGGGCRCDWYQEDLRRRGFETSNGPSTHQGGGAADVSTGKHTGLEIEAAARRHGILAVGVGKRWAHLDRRLGKVRRWFYGKR